MQYNLWTTTGTFQPMLKKPLYFYKIFLHFFNSTQSKIQNSHTYIHMLQKKITLNQKINKNEKNPKPKRKIITTNPYNTYIYKYLVKNKQRRRRRIKTETKNNNKFMFIINGKLRTKYIHSKPKWKFIKKPQKFKIRSKTKIQNQK